MKTYYTISAGSIGPTPEPSAIVHYEEPTPAEREEIISAYGIDPHDLDSALDEDEVARLEQDGGNLTVIFIRPRNYSSQDKLLFNVTSVGIFLNSDRIVIVQRDSGSLLENKYNSRVRDRRDVVLRLFVATVAHFLGHLRIITMLSESLERKLTTNMETELLLNLFTLKKSLVYFQNGLEGNGLVLRRLQAYAVKHGWQEELTDLLEDALIENSQGLKQAEIQSDILKGMMDAHGNIVSNKQNRLIHRLTIINVVFMPMNLVAAIGGMSEFTVFTHGIPWPVSYGIFAGAMLVMGLLTYRIIKFRGWGRRS